MLNFNRQCQVFGIVVFVGFIAYQVANAIHITQFPPVVFMMSTFILSIMVAFAGNFGLRHERVIDRMVARLVGEVVHACEHKDEDKMRDRLWILIELWNADMGFRIDLFTRFPPAAIKLLNGMIGDTNVSSNDWEEYVRELHSRNTDYGLRSPEDS